MNEILQESKGAYYSKKFPTIFRQSRGSLLTDRNGRDYIDFFSGAGALNYGHNHPRLIRAVQEYLADSGVIHSLDMATEAKFEFIKELTTVLYTEEVGRFHVMFPGPTGTNCVEAAMKLCRISTGRRQVIAFEGAYHGMTLGSLAATSDPVARAGAGVPLRDVTFLPFPNIGGQLNIDDLAHWLSEADSAGRLPAAVILETVQAEGGVNVADINWLCGISRVLKSFEVKCIVDEIQTGCGRVGPFLSYHDTFLQPDVVCMSKSLSGLGVPFSALLVDKRMDCLAPGQHSGTFRGNNLAFVAGAEAIRIWHEEKLSERVKYLEKVVYEELERAMLLYPDAILEVRGKGLLVGLVLASGELASAVSGAAFEEGLLIETCGRDNEVLKLLPALTISEDMLRDGLKRLFRAFESRIDKREKR